MQVSAACQLIDIISQLFRIHVYNNNKKAFMYNVYVCNDRPNKLILTLRVVVVLFAYFFALFTEAYHNRLLTLRFLYYHP